jgi:hypothetical protein
MMGAIGDDGIHPDGADDQSRTLAQVVERKTVQIARLKQLIDSLQEDVISRENEVIKIELEAVAHQKAIEAALEKRAELERRQADAESKHRNLLAAVAKRERDRRALLKQLDGIRVKRRAADQEKEEVDEIEAPVIDTERKLRRIETRISESAITESKEIDRQLELRADQLLLPSIQTEFVNSTATDVTLWLAFYQARELKIQTNMEKLETMLVQLRERCEQNSDMTREYWTNKGQSTAEFLAKAKPAAIVGLSN